MHSRFICYILLAPSAHANFLHPEILNRLPSNQACRWMALASRQRRALRDFRTYGTYRTRAGDFCAHRTLPEHMTLTTLGGAFRFPSSRHLRHLCNRKQHDTNTLFCLGPELLTSWERDTVCGYAQLLVIMLILFCRNWSC